MFHTGMGRNSLAHRLNRGAIACKRLQQVGGMLQSPSKLAAGYVRTPYEGSKRTLSKDYNISPDAKDYRFDTRVRRGSHLRVPRESVSEHSTAATTLV